MNDGRAAAQTQQTQHNTTTTKSKYHSLLSTLVFNSNLTSSNVIAVIFSWNQNTFRIWTHFASCQHLHNLL